MRHFEWRRYRNTIVQPTISKCYRHELYGEISGIIVDIDRMYRLLTYTKTYNKRRMKKRSKSLINCRELDKRWLELDLKAKISYLEELLIMMKLGS